METESSRQAQVLRTVLAINLGFFFLEGLAGFLAGSMGLIADGLDMLADAFVYGAGLLAVRGSLEQKKRVATFSGWIQMVLAILGLIEVIHRFVGPREVPEFRTMIGISLLALVGNAICLVLLRKPASEEVHMRASVIFTSNDVLVNIGVIAAGVLVTATNSGLPDLIIGAAVFLLVTRGAVRILRLGR